MRIQSNTAAIVLCTAIAALLVPAVTCVAAPQLAEGFHAVVFHHNANGSTPTRDFRGMARGYMTAGWWAPGQMKSNYVSWKTAPVVAKSDTTFVFIGATSVLPSEFSRGPRAKLFVNGKYALTFTLGFNQDHFWKEGPYELRYTSKRVEFPYFGSHRELRELHGNSGIFQLIVPADVVEAGKPAELKVELQPFPEWTHGWFMVKDRRDALSQTIKSLEGEIESLRQDVAVLNQLTHMLATQAYAQAGGNSRFRHTIAYENGFRHLHPADLIMLESGELLLMTREGTEHISNDGDVVMLRSSDNGETWSDKQTIAGIENTDEREGCGLQLKDGTILVGVFYNNLYGEDGSYSTKREAEPVAPQNGVPNRLGAYTITSTDDGHSWSEPSFIDTTDMPFANLEGPTDAPIEMPDGSILMAVIGYAPKGDTKNRAAVMLRSTDKGHSWSYISTIAADPGGKLGGFLEPGIVRTKSGRIVAGLRNHGPDNAIWTTYSNDGGETWTAPQQTDMIGHPVDLIQLSDGRLMASYGVRSQHARPEGVRACFSSDDGATWDIRTEVQIRNDFRNWDIGYPESLELPDSRMLTVYYGNLFGKYFIGGTFWRP